MYLKKNYCQGNRQKFRQIFPQSSKVKKDNMIKKNCIFFKYKGLKKRHHDQNERETGRVQREIKRKLLNYPKDC